MWIPAKEYLPHRNRMLFIDHIRLSENDSIAKAIVRDDNPFLVDEKLPSYIGIEYMAQALAGQRGMLFDEAKGMMGFIVSIKSVDIKKPYINKFEEINILADVVHRNNQFEASVCTLMQDEEILTAELSVMGAKHE